MTDTVELGYTDDFRRAVIVNGAEAITSLDALLARAPDADPGALALAVLALRGRGYELIEDPSAFESAYRARAEAEPDTGFEPNMPKLRDFGLPDFTAIAAPERQGETLVFYARETFTGLPYRMEVTFTDGSRLRAEPVAVTPLEGAAADPPPPAPGAARPPGPQPTTIGRTPSISELMPGPGDDEIDDDLEESDLDAPDGRD